jgi:hypothetical protein
LKGIAIRKRIFPMAVSFREGYFLLLWRNKEKNGAGYFIFMLDYIKKSIVLTEKYTF